MARPTMGADGLVLTGPHLLRFRRIHSRYHAASDINAPAAHMTSQREPLTVAFSLVAKSGWKQEVIQPHTMPCDKSFSILQDICRGQNSSRSPTKPARIA